MLPPAALHIADRISTTLMTLVDAVGIIITNRSTPTTPGDAAQTLFFRLAAVITALIRLSIDGPRTPAKHKATTPADPDPTPLASRPPPDRVPSPRRPPGWILEILPDVAPAVASDLAALLADPAFDTLLAAAPSLHRKLRPLLRGLDLTRSQPSPTTPPPRAAPPNRTPPLQPTPAPCHLPPRHAHEPKILPLNSTSLHVHIVTI